MSHKTGRVDKLESNSTIHRRQHREAVTGCSRCPPHGNENKSGGGKRGRTKRRYKDKNRGSEATDAA